MPSALGPSLAALAILEVGFAEEVVNYALVWLQSSHGLPPFLGRCFTLITFPA